MMQTDFQVNLARGMETTITVTVNSEEATAPSAAGADEDNQKMYTITVYRNNISSSDDNNLETLELNYDSDDNSDTADVDLFAAADTVADGLVAFTAETESYTGRIASDGPSVVTVNATKDDPGAMIGDITPADADSDNSGHQVELRKGTETVISVPVMAEDGTSKTYTVKLYRKSSAQSDDATLSSLSLSGVTLSESFASDQMTYTARAAYDVSQTTVMYAANHVGALAMVTAPAADADDADGFQVDLAKGMETTITVTVNSEEATAPSAAGADEDNQKMYTITVYRGTEPSNDAKLSDLMLSGITLMPAFDPATTEYTAEVEEALETTTVEATATHPSATVEGTGERSLSAGPNTIDVTVTAEDGTSQTYTVTVTLPSSSDATLQMLALSGITLSPAFDPATTAYTATVDALETTTVEAMATHPNATVEGTGRAGPYRRRKRDHGDGNGRRRNCRNLHGNGHSCRHNDPWWHPA